MLRPSTKEIATVLTKVMTSEQLAVVLNALLTCDQDETLTDRESELGTALFDRIADLSPEAVGIAQSS